MAFIKSFSEGKIKEMKTSQLSSANILYDNGDNFNSKLTQTGIRAITQKTILKRLMKGEEIPDIEGEVRSLLASNGAKFDTYIQEDEEVKNFTSKIELYNNYFQNTFSGLRDDGKIIFGDELGDDEAVEIKGRQVMPDFDFMYENKYGEMQLVKIRTSEFKNPLTTNYGRMEMYGLSAWANNKFPDKTVKLEYDFFPKTIDSNDDYESYAGTCSFEIDDELYNKLETDFEEAIAKGCGGEDCSKCVRNQLCNYEEPPIDLGFEKTIKPLSSINLTQTQREAADFESGIARVIAGAGAGKTLLVAMRVVELIKKGYDPSKIAMLTYTTTGAKEMTERVIRYLAGQEGILTDPGLIKSGTINSFGQDIINDHYEELGYTEPPRVVPDEVRYGIINDVLDSYAKIPEWKYRPLAQFEGAKWANQYCALNKAKNVFADIKKNNWTIRDNGLEGSYSTQSIAMIFLMYQQYQMEMKQKNFIEFDDQLDLVLQLTETHPGLFDEYGYEHIIMDEYQDSNLKQLNIAKAMIDANSFKSFMGVGDDSQSIFSFQDATPEFIINFERYFGEFKDFQLIENHRSSRNVVNNANKINALVDDRVEKDLVATKDDGEPVDVQGFYTTEAEYKFMANDIKKRIEAGLDPSSICVMASTGDELRKIASALTKADIPSVLMNPVPFRKNARVVALCDYYDSFVNHSTKGMIEYENVIQHGDLKTATKEDLDVIIADRKAEIINTPKTLDKFLELANKLDEEKTDVCFQDFLDRLSYCKNMDELDEYFSNFELYGYDSTCGKTKEGHYAGVNLITIHSAKGLEWDTTYLSLTNFDRKQYHGNTTGKYGREINEKRRLWFVGATRAKEKLICTGQFVVPNLSNKDGIITNTFLQQAYELTGKPYDYKTLDYLIAKNEENEKNAKLKAQANEKGLTKPRTSRASAKRNNASVVKDTEKDVEIER